MAIQEVSCHEGNDPGSNIRILVVDDHTFVREGLHLLLSADSRLHIVAQAARGREALEQFDEHHPDVVILDLLMPGMSGLEVAHEMLQRNPGQAILILSAYNYKRYARVALSMGVRGYLLKSVSSSQIHESIYRVHTGGSALSPEITAIFAQNISGDQFPEELSHRELEVLQLVVAGQHNREIARELCIGLKTVESHLAHIYAKLGAKSRAEAVAQALYRGLVLRE
jgi:DNA-binding NarL/FixJ family response regulator